jgi:hypothetical protein
MLLVVVFQDISGVIDSEIFPVGETFGVVVAGEYGDLSPVFCSANDATIFPKSAVTFMTPTPDNRKRRLFVLTGSAS